MKAPVIYKIRNVVNGKFYVGSTKDTRERFRTHRTRLRKNTHHSKHLQAAWNKYGEDCFVFEVVEQVADVGGLQAAEDVWLAEHVGKDYCYNTSRYSASPMRGIATEDHPCYGRVKLPGEKEAISASLKATYAADPTAHPRYGKPHSDETKAKISENRTGKMAGEKHYRFGQTLSAEVREKIGAAQRGVKKGPRTLTEEGRAKIRAAAAAGHYANFTGKKHTEEAKAKMSRPIIATNSVGFETRYPSITALRQATDLLPPTINRALKSGQPLAKGKYQGWSFRYVVSQ